METYSYIAVEVKTEYEFRELQTILFRDSYQWLYTKQNYGKFNDYGNFITIETEHKILTHSISKPNHYTIYSFDDFCTKMMISNL